MKIRFLFALLTSLMPPKALASDFTLGDVLNAAPILSSFESSKLPLLAGETFKLLDTQYTVRFVLYENQNKVTLAEALKAEGLLDTPFGDLSKTPQKIENAIYISANETLKARGLNYVLSLNTDTGMPAAIPTPRQIFLACETLRDRQPKSGPNPPKPLPTFQMNGKNYAIRFFRFYHPEQNANKITFSQYIKHEDETMKGSNLAGTNAVKDEKRSGYYEFKEPANDKGVDFALSIEEVQAK
ncbi:MAG: hypothetical protein KBB83_02115 [Alphaproteobacteria bacterium]|nr:hypothetical protein [Alphaproteobacteria bacterium]